MKSAKYIDRRIIRNRARYGVELFAPKGETGSREVLESLRRGESVALLNDQKFNGGVAAPFFGVLAHTAPGPSTFALHKGLPIVPFAFLGGAARRSHERRNWARLARPRRRDAAGAARR